MEDEFLPSKQRVTFYAPQTVVKYIEKMKSERKDDSTTDAVCQIITEWGSNQHIFQVMGLIDSKFAEALEEINLLKNQNETLNDRLSLVESKCASVNRAVSEMQNSYKRE